MKDELIPSDMLEKDLPPGITILIVGPPGSGKTILSQQLVYQALRRYSSAIYMASKSQINYIVSQKKLFTWDVASHVSNHSLSMVEIRNVTDPTELNINLGQAMNRSKQPLSLVVVDSLTMLMVGIDQGKIMKFTEGLAEKLQDHNVSLLLLATPTTETQDFLTKMKSLVSSVIEIRLEEEGTLRRYMRIFKFQDRKHSTHWFPFEITDKGIQFASSSVKIPDTFLFDLEGTLVIGLDSERIRKEIQAYVVGKGYPSELLEDTDAVETIMRAVEYVRVHEGNWELLKKEVGDYLEQKELEVASRAVCIEGGRNVLNILKERKKKVGIITRYSKEAALKMLMKCDLHEYVDVLLTRDDVDMVNLHLDLVIDALDVLDSDPERTVVLGDQPFEIEAGNKAGCFTVGILTGFGTRNTLKDADLIMNSVKNLGDILTMVEQ
ncbi:MAG: HAD hydrolase-like protein [Theionarchaea archaeon]|nr:HAD hydrolase-like protein [Theionarchaea archaeon]